MNLETYFVETHEWNGETSDCDLVEYYSYDFAPYFDRCQVRSLNDSTILALAVL